MKGGYAGKLLFVDLTKGTLKERPLSEVLARHFIGGYGIGARVLYDMMKPGVDPLGPDNVLGFMTGPLNGTGALFGGRYTVVCKSPVTGGWNDANSGGFFGPELKRAGFDGVFVTGISPKPVYLFIKDGKAEMRDGRALWGKDCTDAQEALIQEIGEPKLRAAIIGPAGRNSPSWPASSTTRTGRQVVVAAARSWARRISRHLSQEVRRKSPWPTLKR